MQDLDLIVSDFNDTIGVLDHSEYVKLLKALRKELADIQLKSWANKLKLKVDEEKQDKAIEAMMIEKMKEAMAADKSEKNE